MHSQGKLGVLYNTACGNLDPVVLQYSSNGGVDDIHGGTTEDSHLRIGETLISCSRFYLTSRDGLTMFLGFPTHQPRSAVLGEVHTTFPPLSPPEEVFNQSVCVNRCQQSP